MEKYCKKCKEKFYDGNLVVVDDNLLYHYNDEECFTKKQGTKTGIYYEDKIYSMFSLAKLKHLKELKCRTEKNSVVITGDLSDIVNCEAIA